MSAGFASCRMAALRGTLKMAWRLGQMTAEDYSRAADLASETVMVLRSGRKKYALLRFAEG